MKKLHQLCSLAVCLLIVASLAMVKYGSIWGHELTGDSQTEKPVDNDTLRTLLDGTVVINTTALGADITGYAGKVPLEISLKDGKVIQVKALENAETPEFFSEASALLSKWNGKTVDDALALHVDGVSGATFSSKAIVGNVQRGLTYAKQKSNDNTVSEASSTLSAFDPSAKNIAGLVVVLMAAILPLFVKNKTYRLCQLLLNVVVLGFWCGAFLSYTSLLGYMANGFNVLALLVPFVMLVTAFVYPLFGKKTYYCTHVCPFGSLQQVVAKSVKYKVKMSPKTAHRLDLFRQVLWALLMLCIWGGVWSDWTDYEPFSAFIFQSASWIVIALAAAFVLMSFIITRPYCRFVCPMGTLLKLSQASK